MSQSFDRSLKVRRGGIKRKERNLNHVDEGESDIAFLPTLKKERCQCEWLFLEVPKTTQAKIQGDHIFEEQIKSLERRRQAEKDANVGLGCSSNEQNLTRRSIRSCMQTCMEEISTYREHIMAWMRKEMHNFVYGESPASGSPLNRAERAGVGTRGHENPAESLNIEARMIGNNRFAEQDSECKCINPERLNYSGKPESVSIAGDEIHDIGVLFRGQDSESRILGLNFGVQNEVHGGLKLGVQSTGQIEGMQKLERRHPAYELGDPDCSGGVLGFGLTGQADGCGVNLADCDRSDFQGACSFTTDISNSANNLDLGRSSGLSYCQTNLAQGAGLQGPPCSMHHPSTLGMMCSVMHNTVGGGTRASNRGLINYSSEVTNKTSNGGYIGMHSSYERNLEILNSSIINSSNRGVGMQFPLDLHTPDTSGGMQAFIGLPSPAGVQAPVGTQDFLNLSMAEYTRRAGISNQLLCPEYFESTSHEKFVTGHDILGSAFASRRVRM